MNIISMAWTTPAFVAQAKHITRRHWNPTYAKRFRKGVVIRAYSTSPLGGGVPIGKLVLTADPVLRSTAEADPIVMYEQEGFGYLDMRYCGLKGTKPLRDATERWVKAGDMCYEVPFDIIEIFPGIPEKYDTDELIISCVEKLLKVLP